MTSTDVAETEATDPGGEFAVLFGGPRESSDLVGIARAATRVGYALIAVRPGDKAPLCTLTERQATTADKAARKQARDAGERQWERKRHACGRAHAITDPKVADRVFKRLVERYPDVPASADSPASTGVNLGLEVGRSRLLCIDADTAEQVTSFRELWAEQDGDPDLRYAAPTVRSPGKKRGDEWIHSGGGHFWFTLPPEHPGFVDAVGSSAMPIGAHEDKAQCMFRDALVLVPPSVRAEGPYRMASDITEAPAWLLDLLTLHVEGRALRRERISDKIRDGDDNIDVWATQTTWDSLLLDDGWTTSGRPDVCTCPIWTRPGDWSNPKSATAHDTGCTRYDTETGSLHLWTDSPPPFLAAYRAATGHSTLSKLQYLAWRDHGGDSGAAMLELDIISSRSEPSMNFDDILDAIGKAPVDAGAERVAGAEALDPGAEGPAAVDPPPAPAAAAQGPADGSDESDEDDDDAADNEDDDEEGMRKYLFLEDRLAGYPAYDRNKIAAQFLVIEHREQAKELHREWKGLEDQDGLRERINDDLLSAQELAALPRVEPNWCVTDLLQVDHHCLLTAPAKAGKTVLVSNMLKSLSTGEPFLGQLAVPRYPGRILVVDIEMGRNQHTRWVQDIGLNSPDVLFKHLRGSVADFDITLDSKREKWLDLLRKHEITFLVIDPLAPLLSAAGLDENSSPDVLRWFTALTTLCAEAGVTNSVTTHHHGHLAERSRGASGLLQVPDALWKMVRDEETQSRFFSAEGREILMPESELTYNDRTRELTMERGVSRKELSNPRRDNDAAQNEIMGAIRGNPGCSQTDLAALVSVRRRDLKTIIDQLVLLGLVEIVTGAKGAHRHYAGGGNGLIEGGS